MNTLDTRVHIGRGLYIKNPVMTASGTYGYGLEYEDFVELQRLGGIMVKGTTLHARQGNPYPRMAETPAGMLNADTAMIVNVSGSQIEDYIATAERINALERIPAIELNISCPNVKEGGMAFGVTCAGAASVVRAVRAVYDKTLIVKLSPNVTDITEIARAVEAEGADAISMINTLLGMAIDAERRRPVLSTVTGGLSGPAVKPIALRMVWQTAQAIKLPIIGMGGIATASDAIEFLLAGASAIEVGTYNFVDPTATVKIVDGIEDYMRRHGFASVSDLVGALQLPSKG